MNNSERISAIILSLWLLFVLSLCNSAKAGGVDCEPTVKTVYKTKVQMEYVPIEIELKTEAPVKRNRVRLHLGVAPLRSLDYSLVNGNTVSISNKQGLNVGISYDRLIFSRQGISLGAIILTNGTVLSSIGLDF